jgi:hypothetical protein
VVSLGRKYQDAPTGASLPLPFDKLRRNKMLGLLLIILLVVLLLVLIPVWPYSSEWGYFPGGLVAVVLIVVVVLLLAGVLR